VCNVPFGENPRKMKIIVYVVYSCSEIMAEYNDCVSRAQRLSVARESFLAGDTLSVASVRVEDLFIYLRWLVTHLTTVRQFHQYLKVIVSLAWHSFSGYWLVPVQYGWDSAANSVDVVLYSYVTYLCFDNVVLQISTSSWPTLDLTVHGLGSTPGPGCTE